MIEQLSFAAKQRIKSPTGSPSATERAFFLAGTMVAFHGDSDTATKETASA